MPKGAVKPYNYTGGSCVITKNKKNPVKVGPSLTKVSGHVHEKYEMSEMKGIK